MQKLLSSSQFKELLDDFSSACRNRKYHRVIYSKWSILDRLANGRHTVLLNLYEDGDFESPKPHFDIYGILGSNQDYTADPEEKSFIHLFLLNDESFGSFVYKEVFGKDGAKVTDNLLNKNEEKEKSMKKNVLGLNIEFGKCGSDYKLSPYGIAVKNRDGVYVAFDVNSNSIMNVDAFNFDSEAFLFKMPVAVKDIAIGDVVLHHGGVPMFVKSVSEGGEISAVDVVSGEVKEILPTKNMFGFNFVTKVINLLGNLADGASADNPFGNLLLAAALGDGDGGLNPMLMMVLMGGENPFEAAKGGNIFSNPLMMMALMGDDKSSFKDILPMMMFSQMNK